jgi:hypothetical protein
MSIVLFDVRCYRSLLLGYAVTIMVDGGLGSLEVLENDIDKGRPIILIQVDDHRCPTGDLVDRVSLTIRAAADLPIAYLHSSSLTPLEIYLNNGKCCARRVEFHWANRSFIFLLKRAVQTEHREHDQAFFSEYKS